MSFILTDEKTGGSNLKWLGSAHATNEAQTLSLIHISEPTRRRD